MDADDTEELLRRAADGDRQSLDELLGRHRARLRRMAALRLDPRVRGRIDASDVVQEATMEAYRRLGEYLEQRKLPFFLWLRFLTNQKVLEVHRRHLGAQRRDARREVQPHRGPWPESASVMLAEQLSGKLTGPSRGAMRAELEQRLRAALESMDQLDCQIVALRHFEQLSNAEAAAELGIDTSAASKRYVRAMRKLTGVLKSMGIEP